MGDALARNGSAGPAVHSAGASGRAGSAADEAAAAPATGRARLPDGWAQVLRELGVDDRAAMSIADRAQANRTCFHAELMVSGRVREDALFAAVARALGLRFLERVPSERLVIDEAGAITVLRGMRRNAMVPLRGGNGAALFVIAPYDLELADLRTRLGAAPGVAGRLVVTSPGALRAALMARAGAALAREASLGLFGRSPDFSARFITNPWQAFATGLLLAGAPVLLYAAPDATTLALSGFLTLLFLGCVGLRLLAGAQRPPLRPAVDAPDDGSALPIYSVLVALHREADVVPDLLAALGRLDWPRSRLEVKLVCEADDAETLAALERHALRSWVEIVRVPPGSPRTKPKALNFALPTCTGDIVALYDAEDRPHPQQLRAAWNALRNGGEHMACVQAPLQIANAAFGVLPFMFRMEFAAQFRGLLPWLAGQDLLIPLGGTSNHFRRAALEEVGAWDPHNVTEDADLGVRLARFGYRVGVIAPPTLEDAPETFPIWFRQRTRWFKGFLQTWLVHMRTPGRLYRELGPGSFAIFHLMIGGVVVSALLHPLLLATMLLLVLRLAAEGGLPHREAIVLGLATMNVIGGYGAQLLLSWSSLDQGERAGFWKAAVLTPAYWMMLSAVACRAVWELARNPHHWAKTPHRRYRRAAPAVRDSRAGVTLLARLRRHLPMMSAPEQTIRSSSSPMTESSRSV